MRKFLVPAVGLVALASATSSQASLSVDSQSSGMIVTPVVGTPYDLSFGYTDFGSSSPFSEFITFTNSLAGIYTVDLSTSTSQDGSATDVDFDPSSVYLTGGSIIGTLLLTPTPDSTELFEHYILDTSVLGNGTYTLNIGGTRGIGGTFSGNLTFAAVPEPATWAMMLLGFGGIGFAFRRRKSLAVAPQLA